MRQPASIQPAFGRHHGGGQGLWDTAWTLGEKKGLKVSNIESAPVSGACVTPQKNALGPVGHHALAVSSLRRFSVRGLWDTIR